MSNYTRNNSLRLKEWDYSQPGPYFVTLCTSNRTNFFSDSEIRNKTLQTILQIHQSFNVTTHTVCVADEHTHLLITLPDKQLFSLGSHIARMKVILSKSFVGQRIHWQRSYYDHIIRDEKDFYEKAQYIENHPYKEQSSQYAEWH